MSHDLKDIILQRRTIHSYNDKAVTKELLHEGIECFLHAPNHRLTQPWKILSVDREKRLALGQRAIKLKLAKKTLSETEKLAIKAKYTTPSHLLALLQIKSENSYQSKEDYAAISCGVMNMSLFYWSKKIGTKWSSGAITSEPTTYKLLNVDMKLYEIVGFLWVGYFDHLPRKPKKLSVGDVLI